MTAEADVTPEILEAVEKSADRNLILSESRRLFDNQGIAWGFDELIAANDEYNSILRAAIDGQIDEVAYNTAIWRLHSKLPTALTWLERVEKRFLPMFANVSAQNQSSS